MGLCDKMRDKQRLERAKILRDFRDEMIAAGETHLHDHWLTALGAEIAAINRERDDRYSQQVERYLLLRGEDV